jgi:TPR repeat protein
MNYQPVEEWLEEYLKTNILQFRKLQKTKENFDYLLQEIDKNKNHVKYITLLAIMNSQGFGMPKDNHKAIDYFERACKQNYPPAIYHYAYFNETQIEPNLDKAKMLYYLAVEKKYKDAFFNLAYILDEEDDPTKISEAIQLYNKAIERECPLAMNNLALMYYNGRGVEKDFEKAKELLEKSAKLNYKIAHQNLEELF